MRLVVMLAAFAGVAAGQTDLDPALIAQGQIRYRMARSLQTVTNYTCAETLQRAQWSAKKSRKQAKREEARVEPDFSDTVRLEVAVVDGAEIYSWPGEEFRPVPLADIIGFGMAATGSFSSFAKSLFVTSQGRISYFGKEDLNGRKTLRYDYGVSLFRSGYVVTTQRGEAKVAYEGSFWAGAEDYRLLRLTVRASELPPELGLRSLDAEVRYSTVPIGDELLTLASSSRFEMVHADDTRNRNDITFDNCREFVAASTISFDAGEPAPPDEEPAAGFAFNAPVGAEIHVELVTEIASGESRVGDPIEARVTRAVSVDGKTVIEKGARLTGRLRRMHRVGRAENPYYAISLEFDRLRTRAGAAPLRLELVRSEQGTARKLSTAPDVRTSRRGQMYGIEGGVIEETVIEEEGDRGLAGVESMYTAGASVRLRKGFAMTWRVVAER